VAALMARVHAKLRNLSRAGNGCTFAGMREALIYLAVKDAA